jgi:hypothetical protein
MGNITPISSQLLDVLAGMIIAVPFLLVRQYFLRVALSSVAPLVVYWKVLKEVHDVEAYWSTFAALRLVLGGLCVAHLRVLWSLCKARILKGRHEKLQ